MDLNRDLFIVGVIVFGIGLVAWYIGNQYSCLFCSIIYGRDLYELAIIGKSAFPFLLVGGGILAVISLVPMSSSKEPLPTPQVEQKEQIKYCGSCGTANPIDNAYCLKCGKKFS